MRVAMCIFLCMSCFMTTLIGQTKVEVVDTLYWENSRDTLWYVNYGFDERNPEDEFVLLIEDLAGLQALSEADSLHIRMENTVFRYKISKLEKETIKIPVSAGTYQLNCTVFKNDGKLPGDTIHSFRRYIFNNVPYATIGYVEGTSGCLLGDTISTWKFILKDFEKNPPSAHYEWTIDLKTNIDADGNIFADVFETWDSLYYKGTDTLVLEFRHSYGGKNNIKPEIRIVIGDENSPDDRFITKTYNYTTNFFVYGRPQLTPSDEHGDFVIFSGYKESDTICADHAVEIFELNQNGYDRFLDNSFNAKKAAFNGIFEYKDSVNQAVWVSLTDPVADGYITTKNFAKVEGGKEFQFKRSGLYRVKLEIENKCGKADFQTETLLVQKNDTSEMIFNKTQFCVSDLRADTLVFTDKAKRLGFEPPPIYTWDVKSLYKDVNGQDSTAMPEVSSYELLSEYIYKGGVEYKKADVPENMGSDSTRMEIVFYKSGNYQLHLEKRIDGAECDPVTFEKNIVVGSTPEFLGPDSLLTADLKSAELNICGTLTYTLPNVQIDSNYLKLDSVRLLFAKGSKIDTLRTIPKTYTHEFDSLGDIVNYVVLKARNACGWGTVDSVGFYTRIKPQIEIYRDSIRNNDTLCVGTPYDYHLVGQLPEKIKYMIVFGGKVTVDGVGYDANAVRMDSVVKLPNVIHIDEGEHQQYIKIENKYNSKCFQEYKDTLQVVGMPDRIKDVYSDSIAYCSSLTMMDTKKLFVGDKNDSKTAQWQFKSSGIINQELLPTLTVSGTKDTVLFITTSNGGGCIIKDTVLLKPQALPTLSAISDTVVRCLGDTITCWNLVDYDFLPGVDLIKYTVSFDDGSAVAGNITYKYPISEATTGGGPLLTLGYKLLHIGTNFGGGGCEVTDSVTVKVKRPKIAILRSDTLTVTGTVFSNYDFARLKTPKGIDTLDLSSEPLAWSPIAPLAGSINHKSGGTTIYDYEYNFNDTDKSLDEWRFLLSGKTYCGKTISDTLVVRIPKERLFVQHDTICSNTVDYKLWGTDKTYGEFIDTANIQWNLIKGVGTLSASTGSGVTYTPAGLFPSDTVKIEIKVANINNPGVTAITDTVWLWINTAPTSTYADTMYVPRGAKFEVKSIHTTHGKLSDFGTQFWSVVPGESGTWSNPLNVNATYTFGTPPVEGENFSAKIYVQAGGKEGCATIQDTIVLVNVAEPEVSLKPATQSCAGDSIRLKPLFTFSGKDKFTTLTWTATNGNGAFKGDTIYIPGSSDPITHLNLKVEKRYTPYNGNIDIPKSATGQTSVTIYKKPDFSLLTEGLASHYTHDTLCSSASAFTYDWEWVDINEQVYKTKLTAKHSVGITGTAPDFVMTEGLSEAKFVVSVDLGECTKWNNIRDSILLTRLPALAGDFDAPSVCETTPTTITGFIANTKNFVWSATAGTLDNVTAKNPTFTLDDENVAATVSLTLKSPKNGCTEQLTVTHDVTTMIKPLLNLRDTTICETITSFTPVYDDEGKIGSVVWTTNGSGSLIGENTPTPTYSFDNADKAVKSVVLTAVFTPNSPCHNEPITRQMTVALQGVPKFTIVTPQQVCQGTPLDLDATVIVGENIYNPQWSATQGTFESPAVVNTTYYPGEITGTQTLTITSEGQHGCAGVSQNLSVQVNRAVKPSFSISEPHCLNNGIVFDNTSSTLGESGASWSWHVDGEQKSLAKYQYLCTFDAIGTHNVTLKVTYPGGCDREYSGDIIVNGLPEVRFQCDSIVGEGKIVDFVNQTGGTINNHSWEFAYGDFVSDEGGVRQHRFTAPSAATPVTLFITDANGCTSSLTKTLKVVGLPLSSFVSSVDKCTGIASFENNSTGEDITAYYWEFGDGRISPDKIPTGLSYEILDRDTVYTIKLTVTNAAGSRSSEHSVSLISGLDARMEVMPDSVGCHNMKKKILNNTWGHADKYTITWGDGHSDVMSYKLLSPIPHIYTNDSDTLIKTFRIKLEAKNVCHTDSMSHNVDIHPNSVRAIASMLGNECFGDDYTFLNKSKGLGGGDLMAWWYFEPDRSPISDSKDTVKYAFTNPGEYNIVLKVSDRCNSDIDTLSIRVKGDNQLDFQVADAPYCSYKDIAMHILPEQIVNFTNPVWKYTTESGVLVATKHGASVNFQYEGAQSYTAPDNINIQLTAENEGCKTVIYHTVGVYKTPSALISPGADFSQCVPFDVNFSAVNEGIEKYFWDFKNGSSSTDQTPSKVSYTTAGTYDVLLKVVSEKGCIDSTYRKVTALYTPTASFDILGDTVRCTDGGNFELTCVNTGDDINISSHKWYWSGSLEPFSLLDEGASIDIVEYTGRLGIKLVTTHNENGCRDSLLKTIISSDKVHADIQMNVTNVCNETPVLFTGVSQEASDMLWDLGDGTTTNEMNFEHTYVSPGIYKIRLIANNADGCTDHVNDSIVVYPLPSADFDFIKDNKIIDAGLNLPEGFDPSGLPDIDNGGIRFTNLSTIRRYEFSDENLFYLWDFGDEVTDVTKDPTHRYANNGMYTVSLVTTTTFGCKDSITDLVDISAVKGLFIPTAFAPSNPDEGVSRFEPKGIGIFAYKLQIYDMWGTCVWSTTKLNDGHPGEWWDGTFNGAPLPKGTYLWKASATFIDGSIWEGNEGAKEGAVMLIR